MKFFLCLSQVSIAFASFIDDWRTASKTKSELKKVQREQRNIARSFDYVINRLKEIEYHVLQDPQHFKDITELEVLGKSREAVMRAKAEAAIAYDEKINADRKKEDSEKQAKEAMKNEKALENAPKEEDANEAPEEFEKASRLKRRGI